jgi:hypothetical protein
VVVVVVVVVVMMLKHEVMRGKGALGGYPPALSLSSWSTLYVV